MDSLWWCDPLCSACRLSMLGDYRCLVRGGFKIHVLHEYKDVVRQCILRYKDLGDIYLANVFLVGFQWRRLFFFHDYVVVSVPSSEDRILKRGFDHANLLARSLGLEMVDNVLVNTSLARQAQKSRNERLLIKDDLCVVDPGRLSGKKVLLVDDVMTTGSTIVACCELLREHCDVVVGLCVANVSDLGVC